MAVVVVVVLGLGSGRLVVILLILVLLVLVVIRDVSRKLAWRWMAIKLMVPLVVVLLMLGPLGGHALLVVWLLVVWLGPLLLMKI